MVEKNWFGVGIRFSTWPVFVFFMANSCEPGTGVGLDPSLDCEGGRLDRTTGLCWQDPKPEGWFQWYDAIDYCNNLDLGGYTDWYLPTRYDFWALLGDCDPRVLSEVECGQCDSCKRSENCSAMFGQDEFRYWSSTGAFSEMAWCFEFEDGWASYVSISLSNGVRCARHAVVDDSGIGDAGERTGHGQ